MKIIFYLFICKQRSQCDTPGDLIILFAPQGATIVARLVSDRLLEHGSRPPCKWSRSLLCRLSARASVIPSPTHIVGSTRGFAFPRTRA